eukprot:4920038-Amphidinium_carterae.1
MVLSSTVLFWVWGIARNYYLALHATRYNAATCAHFSKEGHKQGMGPAELREMLCLQLPKDGAREAGQRRPIALLPQVYWLWSAACKKNVQLWRQVRRDCGEVPVCAGALDETLDSRNANRVFQAGVFLNCSKCYERVPLAQLEQFAIERLACRSLAPRALTLSGLPGGI